MHDAGIEDEGRPRFPLRLCFTGRCEEAWGDQDPPTDPPLHATIGWRVECGRLGDGRGESGLCTMLGSRMKVGLVSPYDFASPGGGPAHVQHLARQLRLLGQEVLIFAPSSRADIDLDSP